MISLALILVCAKLVVGQEDEVDHDHAHHSGNPLDWLRDSVPGEPGVDYPILNEVQETDFSCEDRVFGGYYADPEMGCQGYHVCLNHGNNARKLSFLCPNGTIFQQSKLTCEWWFNVDCTEAQSSYNVNELIGTGESLSESNEVGPKRPIPTRTNNNAQRNQPTIVAQPLNPVPNRPEPETPQVTTERVIQPENPEPQLVPVIQTPSRPRPGAQRPANRRPGTPQPQLVTTTASDTSKIQFPDPNPAEVVTERPQAPTTRPNVPQRRPNTQGPITQAPQNQEEPVGNLPSYGNDNDAPQTTILLPAQRPQVEERPNQGRPTVTIPAGRPQIEERPRPQRPNQDRPFASNPDNRPQIEERPRPQRPNQERPTVTIPDNRPQIEERPRPQRPNQERPIASIPDNRPQIEERPRPQRPNQERPTVTIPDNRPQIEERPRPQPARPQGQRGNQPTQTTVFVPNEPSQVEEQQTTALPSYGTNATPQQATRPTRRPNQGTRNRPQTPSRRTQRPQTTVSLPVEQPQVEERPSTPVLQNQSRPRPTTRPQPQVMTTEIPYSDNSRAPQAGTQTTVNDRPKFGDKVTIPIQPQTPKPVNRGRPLFPERTETAPRFQPNQQIDIVEYDVAISGDDIGDIPILFADPFSDIRAPDSVNRLYEVPI